MTEDDKALVERVLSSKAARHTQVIELCACVNRLTAEVERLNEALRECVMEAADWARQAGEAKGKLEGSEMPGIVDGWKAEVERLQSILADMNDIDIIAKIMAENERLREALEIAQDYKDCGCSYDNPNDICLGHLKLFERLNARAALEGKP